MSTWDFPSDVTADMWTDEESVPFVSGYQSTAQSLSDQSWTTMTLSAVSHNTDDMWVIGSPTRLTVKTAGMYLVTAAVYRESARSDQRLLALDFLRDGTFFYYGQRTTTVNGSGHYDMVVGAAVKTAAVNQYFEVRAYQDNTANVAENIKLIRFQAVRLCGEL